MDEPSGGNDYILELHEQLKKVNGKMEPSENDPDSNESYIGSLESIRDYLRLNQSNGNPYYQRYTISENMFVHWTSNIWAFMSVIHESEVNNTSQRN